MSEETEEQTTATASESAEVGLQEHQPQMVPLAALQAVRREKQELQQQLKQKAADEDMSALVEKKDLHQNSAVTKREILEELYQEMNPAAVLEINKHLEKILEKKPWLAASVSSAQNRYSRAYEIVQDYRHLVEEKPVAKVDNNDAKRIVANANKPGNPAVAGKTAQSTGAEYLKSIQGTKEFRDYRNKLRQGGS